MFWENLWYILKLFPKSCTVKNFWRILIFSLERNSEKLSEKYHRINSRKVLCNVQGIFITCIKKNFEKNLKKCEGNSC